MVAQVASTSGSLLARRARNGNTALVDGVWERELFELQIQVPKNLVGS